MESYIEKLLEASENIRVLLIEDNSEDVKLIHGVLSDSYLKFKIKTVSKLSDGVQQLTDNNYDIVLLDLALPDCIGFSTFVQIKSTAPSIPIIVLTGTPLKNHILKQCMSSADSYLVKGHIDNKLLEEAIKNAIEREYSRQRLQAYFLTNSKNLTRYSIEI